MTSTTADVLGPIDFILLEFPQDRLTGEASVALKNLVESGTIRLYDLMVIRKGQDGEVTVLDLADPALSAAGLDYFAGARSNLLGDDDMYKAAEALEPNTVAALIVFENSWAVPFVAAARNSGGELIASARIPAADLMAALEALDNTSDTSSTGA